MNIDRLIEIELKQFGKYVVQQSRSNLSKKKHNASKALYNSLKFKVKKREIEFTAAPYSIFLDKGVSGKKKKYNTPYYFKDKMPPPKAFEKWIKLKGIRYRDKNGKFKKGGVKTLSFLIARSVYNKGIKPTHFFTKPFNKLYERLSDEVVNEILQNGGKNNK